MARKSTLKVNEIKKPKKIIFKCTVCVAKEILTFDADDFNSYHETLDFYLQEKVVASFKEWSYFLMIHPEEKPV